jgi:drebrin-like protein
MASLNLSINGPSIKSSYQAVVNATIPSSSSSTWAHWALFSVQAPLQNAFQDSGSKESVLKVATTGGKFSISLAGICLGFVHLTLADVANPQMASWPS